MEEKLMEEKENRENEKEKRKKKKKNTAEIAVGPKLTSILALRSASLLTFSATSRFSLSAICSRVSPDGRARGYSFKNKKKVKKIHKGLLFLKKYKYSTHYNSYLRKQLYCSFCFQRTTMLCDVNCKVSCCQVSQCSQ